MFQKDDPFVFHPFIFGGSAAQNGGLSLFNTYLTFPANALKTRDLRKRHFRLPIFESREAARTQNVRRIIRPIFFSLPRDPTLHTPPETDPTYSAEKPYIM